MRQEIAGVLDELALRFGETGEALWHSLVVYELASAWAAIVFGVVVLALTPRVIRWISERCREDDMDPAPFFGSIFWGIAVVFATIGLMAAFPALLAPEAAVIQGLFG